MVATAARIVDEKYYQQSHPPDDAADAYETDILLSTKRYNDLPETERKPPERMKHHGRKYDILFMSICWTLWLFLGTFYYKHSDCCKQAWGESFYITVNIGYSIGWTHVTENTHKTRYFSSFYLIVGYLLILTAIFYFVDMVIQRSTAAANSVTVRDTIAATMEKQHVLGNQLTMLQYQTSCIRRYSTADTDHPSPHKSRSHSLSHSHSPPTTPLCSPYVSRQGAKSLSRQSSGVGVGTGVGAETEAPYQSSRQLQVDSHSHSRDSFDKEKGRERGGGRGSSNGHGNISGGGGSGSGAGIAAGSGGGICAYDPFPSWNEFSRMSWHDKGAALSGCVGWVVHLFVGSDAVLFSSLFFLWTFAGILWSKYTFNWPLSKSIYFSLSTLTSAGLYSIPENSSDMQFFQVGLFAATGIPVTMLAIGFLVTFLIEEQGRRNISTNLRRKITDGEFEVLRSESIDPTTGKLDVSKFLLLVFVRQRVVDIRLVDVVLERVRERDEGDLLDIHF